MLPCPSSPARPVRTHQTDAFDHPRGDGSSGESPPPGVNPSVWRDHVVYAAHREPAALTRLVTEYDRYACALAGRMHRSGEPREDLNQVAREALVVALGRFDPARRLPFPAFATPTILGSLRHHYRDRGWLLRVPREAHEVTTQARATSERLTMTLGRQPSLPEVAEAMGACVEELLAAQEAAHARDTAPLSAPGSDGLPPIERMAAVDIDLTHADDRVDLRNAMADIEASNQHLLRLYYFEECTQAEIGAQLGISQMQVSRLLNGTLGRLRSHMMAP